MSAEPIVVDFQRVLLERRNLMLAKESRPMPRNQPWASDLNPASCLRRQVLEIVAHDRKAPPSNETAEHFRAGRAAEKQVLSDLEEMGVEVTEQQRPFDLRRPKDGVKIAGGRIDGMLRVQGIRSVLEIKRVQPWALDQLDTEEDFSNSPWRATWPFQLHLYQFGTETERGLWILTDGRRMKIVPTTLSIDVADAAVRFAEKIMEAVEYYRAHAHKGEKALPGFTEDKAQCLRCAFFKRACNPEIPTEAAEVVVSEEEIEQLDRWWALKPDHKQFEALDKWRKERFAQGPALVIAGPFVVTRTETPRKGYVVDPTTIKTIKVEKIGG